MRLRVRSGAARARARLLHRSGVAQLARAISAQRRPSRCAAGARFSPWSARHLWLPWCRIEPQAGRPRTRRRSTDDRPRRPLRQSVTERRPTDRPTADRPTAERRPRARERCRRSSAVLGAPHSHISSVGVRSLSLSLSIFQQHTPPTDSGCVWSATRSGANPHDRALRRPAAGPPAGALERPPGGPSVRHRPRDAIAKRSASDVATDAVSSSEWACHRPVVRSKTKKSTRPAPVRVSLRAWIARRASACALGSLGRPRGCAGVALPLAPEQLGQDSHDRLE